MLVPGVTVFLSSGCIMMLAMVVSRMAAAELGASSYTWTAVVAVTLTGLALGSFLGGRIADRFHPRRMLSVLFAVSSAACVLVVIVNNALKDWTGLWGLYWPLHVLLHAGLLLLLPGTLLAAAAPVACRMAWGTQTQKTKTTLGDPSSEGGAIVGRVLGTLFAWAACGSIAAVVLAGFFLIPAYGNVVTVWAISVATLAMAFLYWISCWVLYVWGMVFGVLLVLATSSAPWANQSGTAAYLRYPRGAHVLYESETSYGAIAVEQTSQRPDTRVLRLDTSERGTILPSDVTNVQGFPATVGAAIMRGLCRPSNSPSILFLGSGGYVLPRYAKAIWPQSRIRVVEPDTGLTAAATRVLGLDSAAIETIHWNTGAYVSVLRVQQKGGDSLKRYDLIFTQFDNPFNVPFHLVTKQFNDKLSWLLSEEGAYVLSVVDTAQGGHFLGAVVNTLERTFSHVRVVAQAVDHPAAVESFTIIAAWRPLNLAEMLTSYGACPAFRILDAKELDQLKKLCSGIVLTDERAPVGTLLAPAVRAETSLKLAHKCFEQALLLEEQGRGEQSDALYQQVASLDTPVRGDAYAAIGRRHLAEGNLDKAAEAFDAAMKHAAEDGAAAMTTAQIHTEMAVVLAKMNRAPQARQHLAAAVKEFQTEVRQHPRSAVAWERLGDACVLREDWPKASDAFSKCVELEPEYLTHYDKLAKTLEAQGRYEEAVKVVRTQIDLLKKTGRKEAVIQQSQYADVLEYERVKQRK